MKNFPYPSQFNHSVMQLMMRLATWHIYPPKYATLRDVYIFIDHYDGDLKLQMYVQIPEKEGNWPAVIGTYVTIEPYLSLVPPEEELKAKEILARYQDVRNLPTWNFTAHSSYQNQERCTEGRILAQDSEEARSSIIGMLHLDLCDEARITVHEPTGPHLTLE